MVVKEEEEEEEEEEESLKMGKKYRRNKSLPHHKVIGTRALLAVKW